MDILNEALASMRTGRPSSVKTDARAPWGLRFGESAGAGFHVVLSGTCWLVPPDGAGIALGPGDVVFLRSGAEHVLTDEPSSPVEDFEPERIDATSPIGTVTVPGAGARTVLLCGAYHLDQSRQHPLMKDLPEVIHLPARPGRHRELRGAVELLSAELDDPRPGSEGIVPPLIEVLLRYILRAWIDDQPAAAARGWAAALTDPVVGRALQAIHGSPGRPWTVESLGERAGLSRAAFARRFTALVGEPPLAYLTRWRMTTAGRLLRQSGVAVSAVALQSGYTSEFAFTKAFKREYGMPPASYRRLTPIGSE